MSKRGKGAMLLLARLDSNRLPGKQLKRLSPDFTVLELLVQRLNRCQVESRMILATSAREVDRPLIDFAKAHNLDYFCGDLDNVAGRCLEAMKAFDLDWFIRICADSPLMDPKIVDQVAEVFIGNDSDLTSNVFISHDFPYGCSVEIATKDAMQRICDLADDPYYLEHVTAYAYKHPDAFNIEPVHATEVYSTDTQSFTVDTPNDLEKAKWIVNQLDNPIAADLREIVPLAETWHKNNTKQT